MKYQTFFKILEDISPFCEVTDTPALDFSWCLPWVSKPEWAVLFARLRRKWKIKFYLNFSATIHTVFLFDTHVTVRKRLDA